MPIYMQIEGVKGDVTAAGFLGAIELQSAQLSTPRSQVGTGSRSTEASALTIREISLSLEDTLASTELFKAAATGKHLPVVKISFIKGSGSSYLKITMKDVLVSSFSASGGGKGQRPLVMVTLNFAKAEFEVMKEAQSQNAMKDPEWASKP